MWKGTKKGQLLALAEYYKDCLPRHYHPKEAIVREVLQERKENRKRVTDRLKREATYKVINVYEITRHYGGSEEGGWWYNTRECIATFFLTHPRHAKRELPKIEERFKESHKWGDIYSVLDGADIEVSLERSPKKSEDMGRPYYC